ncbi:hypothetical protein TNCV_2238221 [Trichonephila clavipes]|nr:hypothetical protein TNCV_2238221 [Trichonephila clavipes]
MRSAEKYPPYIRTCCTLPLLDLSRMSSPLWWWSCGTYSDARVVVYRASTPQVWGSINGLGKVDSAFHPRCNQASNIENVPDDAEDDPEYKVQEEPPLGIEEFYDTYGEESPEEVAIFTSLTINPMVFAAVSSALKASIIAALVLPTISISL